MSSWRLLRHELGIVWLPGAMSAYRALREDDPEGATLIANAVAALRTEPRPENSTALGDTEFRRLRVERYRVLYELAQDTIRVMHVGSVHDRSLTSGSRVRHVTGHGGGRRARRGTVACALGGACVACVACRRRTPTTWL
jgi:mRNA interferase RelE/StbE